MVAGVMGTATVFTMVIQETGTTPSRSTDADHTDTKTDTGTATDMTLDTGIWVTQVGTQATTRMRRIIPPILVPIQHGRIHRTASAYSNRMAGEFSSCLGHKLWPDEP